MADSVAITKHRLHEQPSSYPCAVLWTCTGQWLRHQHGLTDGHPGIALGGGPEHIAVTWVDRHGTWTPDGVVDPKDVIFVSWSTFESATRVLRDSAWPGFAEAARSWGSTVGYVRRVDADGSMTLESDEVPANAAVILRPDVIRDIATPLRAGDQVAFSWRADPVGSTNFVADCVGLPRGVQ